MRVLKFYFWKKMKKFSFISLGALVISLLLSCSGGGTSEKAKEDSIRIADSIAQAEAEQARLESMRQDSITQASIEQAKFLDLVRRLWKGIPDHGINSLTKSSLSKNFYNLVDVAFSIPTNNPGGIGDEEFLYYWYEGQDSENVDRIVAINIISDSPELRVVEVLYNTFYQKVPHQLNLIKETMTDENGNEQQTWVIDDFDGMKNEIYNYVNTTGKKFINGYADEILEDPEIGEWMSASERENYLNEVEKFKKKFNKVYPNGVVKK